MIVTNTTVDWRSRRSAFLRRRLGFLIGAWYGYRLTGFPGFKWGWEHLCIHPQCAFWIEKGADLTINGSITIGFALKPDIPFPGVQTAGLVVKNGGMFRAENNAVLAVGAHVHVSPNAEVSIGARTFIGYASQIIARQRVEIGADCAISWGVSILDSGLHHMEHVEYSEPVYIGSNVWIGHNASILQGVTIGNGAVIGANSVVINDVPEGVVVAGSQARMVRKNVKWSL